MCYPESVSSATKFYVTECSGDKEGFVIISSTYHGEQRYLSNKTKEVAEQTFGLELETSVENAYCYFTIEIL